MRRAVSHARFSTDLQNEKSIEDQEALNRLFAQKNEYELVKFYSDAAQSGASILGARGSVGTLGHAKERKFDAVIVEELDRLSRDMEDLAGIHKRLSFMNIEIIAVHEGLANTVTVGLRGLVGQLFREDNARKVRRGMQGKIRSGLSAGGKAYGYKPDPLNKGKLLIVPEEADVVRRIFEDVAAGYSPRQIAYHLTAEKAPAPRGSTGTNRHLRLGRTGHRYRQEPSLRRQDRVEQDQDGEGPRYRQTPVTIQSSRRMAVGRCARAAHCR